MALIELNDPSGSEPRREGSVSFDASEILPLWKQQGDWHRLLHQERQEGYRVAAVLPNQELTAEDYDSLGDAGMLVIEVPAEMESKSKQDIASFLTTQLTEGEQATAAGMSALGVSDARTAGVDGMAVEMTDEEEAEFLDFLNDPANQLGGHF